MKRLLLRFAAAMTALLLAPAAALAFTGDKEVARVTSFGGACAKCELSGRKLTAARFVGGNFAGASLVGSDLRQAHLTGSNFGGADLTRADLSDAEITGVNLGGADLSHASLRSSALTGVNLKGADLSVADLSDAVAVGVNFAGADLGHAMLSGADLSRSHGLDQDQLNDACGDGHTRLPDGLSIRPCATGPGHAPGSPGAPRYLVQVP